MQDIIHDYIEGDKQKRLLVRDIPNETFDWDAFHDELVNGGWEIDEYRLLIPSPVASTCCKVELSKNSAVAILVLEKYA